MNCKAKLKRTVQGIRKAIVKKEFMEYFHTSTYRSGMFIAKEKSPDSPISFPGPDTTHPFIHCLMDNLSKFPIGLVNSFLGIVPNNKGILHDIKPEKDKLKFFSLSETSPVGSNLALSPFHKKATRTIVEVSLGGNTL
jgi:hypothetical protein